MNRPITFLFDFDSTLVGIETLDATLELSLREQTADLRTALLAEIHQITNAGMAGAIDLQESIRRRLSLGKVHRRHVQTVAQNAVEKMTPGFRELCDVIRGRGHQLGIVSGALGETIGLTAAKLHIAPDWIFANQTIYDKEGFVAGVADLPLAYSDGKATVIRQLKTAGRIPGRVVLTGDGASDLIALQAGAADDFLGFGIHAVREPIERQAPHFFYDMQSYTNYVASLIE